MSANAFMKKRNCLEFKSDPQNVSIVEEYVDTVVKSCNCEVSESVYGNILVVLTEAVNNAILHGNGADSAKTVKVTLTRRGNHLKFLVEDEGKGFDPDELPDPTQPENLLKPGGRGVFLMRQLSDRVEFHHSGRLVEIHFYL